MHISRLLIPALVLIIVLSAAGCTSPSSSSPSPAAQQPAAASPATTLSSFALTSSDLPAGWTQVSARAKESSEVSRTAHSLGWQAGYVVTFVNSSAPAEEQDTIVQTLAVYPASNTPGVLGLMNTVETNLTGMTIRELPVSGIGTSGFGFVARVSSGVTPRSTQVSIMSEMAQAGARKSAGPEEDFAEVYFSNGALVDVIRMTGPHANGDTVVNLAQAAYSKIS